MKNSYLLFIIVIFLSAFLLFQIQPIISKSILPWFGGTASVWTICMIFFQALLFAGYFYSHIITLIKNKLQLYIHTILLILAFLLIFYTSILPKESMKPLAERSPIFQIILILLLTVGLPYFILSASSPLLQHWFSKVQKEREPYILYSFSNLGSMLGLLTYPFLIEPMLSLKFQSKIWISAFIVFIVLLLYLIWFYINRKKEFYTLNQPSEGISKNPKKRVGIYERDERKKKEQGKKGLTLIQRICWFILPMNSSIMLLAFTNKLCIDIPSVPLLWVLPLSIYLLSYIITFSGSRYAYHRAAFFVAIVLGGIGIFYDLRYPCTFSFAKQLAIYVLTLYFASVAAHGELYRLRPQSEKLTSYYLTISAGSVIGSIFVGIIAPLLFPDYFEVNISIIIILGLLTTLYYEDIKRKFFTLKDSIYVGCCIGTSLIIASLLVYHIYFILKYPLEIRRNFYGVVRIFEMDPDNPSIRKFHLMHGYTDHGAQYTDPSRREEPIMYYSRESGVGMALLNYARGSSLKVGVVGLGIGTLALYAQKGDYYRFYEINPDVIDLAQDSRYFTCLQIAKNRGAIIDIVKGDARLSMEKEILEGHKNEYDILILDAFNSDAIPLHLLTKEAFDIYFQLLKKEGILAVHVTNRNIDLSPVILSMAEHFLYHPFFLINYQKADEGIYFARWILLSNNPFFVKKYFTGNIPVPDEKRLKRLWTDDFTNIWKLLK